MKNITSLLTELDSFNESYIINECQENRMENINPELINELNSLQKYELNLNQKILMIDGYHKLTKSITDFENIEKYNISFDELKEYIDKRLVTNISLDRRYLFNELLLNFCESKDKQPYTKDVIELLKELIRNKLDANWKIVFILYTRFFILCERFKIYDDEFVEEINSKFIENFQNIRIDFSLLYFFEHFFKIFKTNMIYYSNILETFNKFVELIDKYITDCNLGYNPLLLIAEMYKKIDNNRSIYFYEKYIDFFLRNYQEITIENILRGQFEIKSYLELSRNIKYKFKELKDLSTRFADFMLNNSDILFSQTKDNDLEDFAHNFYEDFKMRFSHFQGNELKLTYLVYNLFHTSFCTEQFEIHENNKKDTFSEAFFFTKTSSDHMGFLHSVNNNSEFNFFRTKEEIINSILVYLDEDLNWVSAATPIILENISNLSILEDYKSQCIKAINSFLNQEYIEFMYIGPAIIERILKNYLIEIDGNVKTFRIDTVVDKTLNQIIEKLLNNNNCGIDKYLLKYFAYILVNSDGLNLRNLVLHGNCQDNLFNKYNSMYIYIILIYLIRVFSKTLTSY